MRANLDGLRRDPEGCGADYAGLGFDDMLADVGATATRGHAARAGGRGAGGAGRRSRSPTSIRRWPADSASVVALRDAIGAITTTIKTRVLHDAQLRAVDHPDGQDD